MRASCIDVDMSLTRTLSLSFSRRSFSSLRKKKGNLLSDPSTTPPRSPNALPSTTTGGQPSSIVVPGGGSSAGGQAGTLPSFSSLLASPSPTSAASTSPPDVQPARRNPAYIYEPTAYSTVAGDGAIGNLEWSPDSSSENIGGSNHEYAAPSPSANILVPTLGQIDQLTQNQEEMIARAQAQAVAQANAESNNAANEKASIITLQPITQTSTLPSRSDDAADEDFEPWNSISATRSRSGGETLSQPSGIARALQANNNSATAAPATVSAGSNVSTPVASTTAPHSAASTPSRFVLAAGGAAGAAGGAAMVAGSRSTSGVSAGVVKAPPSAAVASGGGVAPSSSNSNPGSRRGSGAGLPLAAHSGVATSATASTPSTPVLSTIPGSATSTALLASASPVAFEGSPPLVGVSGSPERRPLPALPTSASNTAVSTPSIRPGGFSYPRNQPTTRPSIHGPHSSMMQIGRAAADEMKTLVSKDRLTGDSNGGDKNAGGRITSPGYLAYVSAIAEAEKANEGGSDSSKKKKEKEAASEKEKKARDLRAEKEQEKAFKDASKRPRRASIPPSTADLPLPDPSAVPALSSSGASSRRSFSGSGPPLPPRTHAYQRYSLSGTYGSRRGSAIAGTGNGMEKAQQDTKLTIEQLIPLDPFVHLVGTTYLLMYFFLHLYLPALLALGLPLACYYLLHRLALPIDAWLSRRYPILHEQFSPLSPRAIAAKEAAATAAGGNGAERESVEATELTAVTDDSILDEVEAYHQTRTSVRNAVSQSNREGAS
jgi:hypothetical protein